MLASVYGLVSKTTRYVSETPMTLAEHLQAMRDRVEKALEDDTVLKTGRCFELQYGGIMAASLPVACGAMRSATMPEFDRLIKALELAIEQRDGHLRSLVDNFQMFIDIDNAHLAKVLEGE